MKHTLILLTALLLIALSLQAIPPVPITVAAAAAASSAHSLRLRGFRHGPKGSRLLTAGPNVLRVPCQHTCSDTQNLVRLPIRRNSVEYNFLSRACELLAKNARDLGAGLLRIRRRK